MCCRKAGRWSSRSTNGTWREGPSALFNGIKAALDEGLSQARGVPLLTVSGKTGKGIDQLLGAAFEVRETWSKRVSTGQLNRWFEEAVEKNPPPAPGGKRIKLRYITQVNTRPPSFVLFGTRVDQLPDTYLRYLVNGIRQRARLRRGAGAARRRAPRSNPFGDGQGLALANSFTVSSAASSTSCLLGPLRLGATGRRGPCVDEAAATIVDWAKFAQMRSELGASFVRILGYFREDGEKAVAKIEQAMHRRDAAALVLPAHTMKAEARQFGAEPLADLAEEIEMAGRRALESRLFPDDILPQVAKLRPLYRHDDRPARGRRPTRSRSAAARSARSRATRNSAGSEPLKSFACPAASRLGSAPIAERLPDA